MLTRYDVFILVADFDPLQSLIDPSLSNVDLNMSLMPPIREYQDVDDDATINDAPSLTEDLGNYDSHGEDDDTFPELDFSQQPSRGPLTHQLLNTTISTSSVNTSTPIDHWALPEQQQQYPLPTYDEVMHMDSNSTSSSTHYYPDESLVTYRHKNTT